MGSVIRDAATRSASGHGWTLAARCVCNSGIAVMADGYMRLTPSRRAVRRWQSRSRVSGRDVRMGRRRYTGSASFTGWTASRPGRSRSASSRTPAFARRFAVTAGCSSSVAAARADWKADSPPMSKTGENFDSPIFTNGMRSAMANRCGGRNSAWPIAFTTTCHGTRGGRGSRSARCRRRVGQVTVPRDDDHASIDCCQRLAPSEAQEADIAEGADRTTTEAGPQRLRRVLHDVSAMGARQFQRERHPRREPEEVVRDDAQGA